MHRRNGGTVSTWTGITRHNLGRVRSNYYYQFSVVDNQEKILRSSTEERSLNFAISRLSRHAVPKGTVAEGLHGTLKLIRVNSSIEAAASPNQISPTEDYD